MPDTPPPPDSRESPPPAPAGVRFSLSSPAPQPPATARRFGDHKAVREALFANALHAARALPAAENSRYRLHLSDLTYPNPAEYGPQEMKKARLEGRTLARRLVGTVTLTDKATGNVVDSKRTTVAHVPYLTDHGTFILSGDTQVLSHQLRLDPGVYVRRRESGETEAHVNLHSADGAQHRLRLDPKTGVVKVDVGQAEIPAYPLLKALGADDGEIDGVLGPRLAAANRRAAKPQHLAALYEKLGPRAHAPDDAARAEGLRKRLESARLDPWVAKRTLGVDADRYGKRVALAAVGKVLAVHRGDAEPDARDALEYQTLHGPEHLVPERVGRAGPALNAILWQVTNKNSLKPLQPGFLNPAVRSVFLTSGLAQSPELVSAVENMDHGARVTKVGEGGIGRSADAVPQSARDVHPSQFLFLDPVRTSESESVGLDLRTAFGTRLRADKRLEAPVRDAKTGKLTHVTPRDLADAVVATPEPWRRGDPVVPVVAGGKLTYAPRAKVTHVASAGEQLFGALTNLVPLKSGTTPHRSSMAARMVSQALPLVDPEAPLVRAGVPGQPGKSFEELYGRHAGAVHAHDRPGVVKEVGPDGVTVAYQDGTVERHPLYDHYPLGRSTMLHNTPVVRPGQSVRPGQLLARSNVTDDKGHATYGKNARVALVPYLRGKFSTYEDSVLVSRSFANRLTSEHLYQHRHEPDEHTTTGREAYAAAFPGRHPLKMFQDYDEKGVVKPGTVVTEDQPLVMAVRREPGVFGVLRGRKAGLQDASVTWDHSTPGEVVDVRPAAGGGYAVTVKTHKPFQPGDKLCYAPDTEVLTAAGWKPVAAVAPGDRAASLTDDGRLEYVPVAACHRYHHEGDMYHLETTQVSLLVTPNHNLYAEPRNATGYAFYSADELYGRRYRLKTSAVWAGGDEPPEIELPDSAYTCRAGQGGRGLRSVPPVRIPTEAYLLLLGAFLTDGSVIYQPKNGTYGLHINQVKRRGRARMAAALAAAGVQHRVEADAFIIYGRGLAEHFRRLGKKAGKRMPEFVFGFSARLLEILYTWMMRGNGSEGQSGHSFCSGAPAVVDGFQRLCLHTGRAARVWVRPAASAPDTVKGVPVKTKSDCYYAYVYRSKLRPTINHGHVRAQGGQTEEWVPYVGPVYCVTLATNHVLYTRRRGRTVWCGNSGLGGNKGVANVVEDDEMPHTPDGKPLDAIFSSLGNISRVNPKVIVELALGKAAAARGRPYVVHDFEGVPHLAKFAKQELAKYGLADKEHVTDPVTGVTTREPVTVGNMYVMKLSHQAEKKLKGRGVGGYDEAGTPTRGPEGASRMAMGDVTALVAHGAGSVLRDLKLYRGQENSEFWSAYMAGEAPPPPAQSKQYDRFLDLLRGAGVDPRPVDHSGKLRLHALTPARVKELAGNRVTRNADTVDPVTGRPVKGGLFDPEIHGAADSATQWSKIELHEPQLNPAFEDPVRHLLGLTRQGLRDVIAGVKTLPGNRTGPVGLRAALANLDVPAELEKARTQLGGTRGQARDDVAKRLRTLKGLAAKNEHPADWFLEAVPVLPPAFRPVRRTAGRRGRQGLIVSDINVGYREVLMADQALRGLKGRVDDLSQERLGLYDALKGALGYGDFTDPRNARRDAKGVLRSVFPGSAKYSVVAQKLLGGPADLSGRGQVVPNADLDMDEVGLPEYLAWEVFGPSIVRRLSRTGHPRPDAVRAVLDRNDKAKRALLEEMRERPVTITRYPALHRFNVIGQKAMLVPGDAIQTNPLINKSQSLDHDGDTITVHAPVSDEAVREVYETLLPSRNLRSPATFKAGVYPMNMEFVTGAHELSTRTADHPPRVFKTKDDAVKAYREGRIRYDTPVEILEE